MRLYRTGAHRKYDLKVHLVWVPKYRKRVLMGEVSVRIRELIRQIAMEHREARRSHEIVIVSGKVAVDHIHLLISYKPTQEISMIVQYFKGISSRVVLHEFAHLRRIFWGKHFWARGYLAVSSGNITDEMIQRYIEEQEGEPIDDRFLIDL